MRPWFLLPLTLLACSSAKQEDVKQTTLAAAVNDDGLAMVVCDTVVSYGAPSPDAAGSLVLKSSGWKIAPGATLAGTELLVKDAQVCAHLHFDGDQVIEDCSVEAAPTVDVWASD